MQVIFLDYETYYDSDYSLRKMTPVEYVLDPRFELIGCAVKITSQGNSFWIEGADDFQAWLNTLDPNEVMFVSHNALFDMCINAWRFNFIPRFMSDTLGIARALFAHKLARLSLDKVAQHLGLGFKGDAIITMLGINLAALRANPRLHQDFIGYAKNDVELCAGIWRLTVETGLFPMDELVVMDIILRCCIQPRFLLDQTVLAEHLYAVKQTKEHMLTKAMLVGATGKSDLMSNESFAALLRENGVEPPTKVSPSTGLVTYAFAKSDKAFVELEEHPDAAIQALVAARLGHKSTLDESRGERLQAISRLTWPATIPPSSLPIPLKFSGAHTHRFGGDWKLNFQNLPTRVKIDKHGTRTSNNKLRSALTCAEDEIILTVDSAQIQARLTACICGQSNLVEAFRNKEDVYSTFASSVFGKPVNKTDNPTERFVGKQAVLGLGFGLGWERFIRQLAMDSRAQTGTEIIFSEGESKRVVDLYRNTYPEIPKTWKAINYVGIPVLKFGSGAYSLGPCKFEQGSILLPNGLRMHYDDLTQDSDGNWHYRFGNLVKRTYGGSILENIVQALERIIIMGAAVRIRQRVERLNIWLNLQGHDELVYIVKKVHAPVIKDLLMLEMSRAPDWMPDLPLAAEVGEGRTYADAK